jgi:hypothetical protein
MAQTRLDNLHIQAFRDQERREIVAQIVDTEILWQSFDRNLGILESVINRPWR